MASLACGPLTRAAAMADFIGAVAPVPHNAAFDLTFLNVELE
jgi:DNA polymerase III epsilon subunit-like protein